MACPRTVMFEPEEEFCDGIDNNCDGLTDEGFSNMDGDSQVDCVDKDDDGDGILDGQDNCSLVPTRLSPTSMAMDRATPATGR